MSRDLKNRVDFKLIRYANCWEDADILTEAMQAVGTGKKFLSIASAGDNSFSLLTLNPQLVVAVDVNKIQLHLVELKKCAIRRFSRDETLAFLGFTPCTYRFMLYKLLRPQLGNDARTFWDAQQAMIEAGVIYAGKFERYFKTFAGKILPWIHNAKRTAELFRPKTAIEQEVFYNRCWNNRRWRLLFRIFFSKYVMGKYGRDPEFLKEVNISVPQYIYRKAAKQLRSVQAQSNAILYFNLHGHFGPHVPHYLREENYALVKQNIDKLVLAEGYAQDAVWQYGKFDGMNLSNIFEYMDKDTFAQTAEGLVQGINRGGKLCYWNLMVPRMISAAVPQQVLYNRELSARLGEKDKGFFYNRFIVETAL